MTHLIFCCNLIQYFTKIFIATQVSTEMYMLLSLLFTKVGKNFCTVENYFELPPYDFMGQYISLFPTF